jgi:hypothetical protein
MSEKNIPLIIECSRPTLVVGKKYELKLYDLYSYEGYDDTHQCISTIYIVYEGGDIANYFFDSAKGYADSEFRIMEYLGDYYYHIMNGEDSEHENYYDLVLDGFSTRSLVSVNPIETEEHPCSHTAIGLMIHEYREPNFTTL